MLLLSLTQFIPWNWHFNAWKLNRFAALIKASSYPNSPTINSKLTLWITYPRHKRLPFFHSTSYYYFFSEYHGYKRTLFTFSTLSAFTTETWIFIHEILVFFLSLSLCPSHCIFRLLNCAFYASHTQNKKRSRSIYERVWAKVNKINNKCLGDKCFLFVVNIVQLQARNL